MHEFVTRMTGRFGSPEIEALLTLMEGSPVFSVLKQTVKDDLKLNIAGFFWVISLWSLHK